MAQTPQQKRANEKHAKTIEKRMGKPEATYKKKDVSRSPVSKIAVGLLIFAVVIPLLLEPMKLIPQIWGTIMELLAKVGIVSR